MMKHDMTCYTRPKTETRSVFIIEADKYPGRRYIFVSSIQRFFLLLLFLLFDHLLAVQKVGGHQKLQGDFGRNRKLGDFGGTVGVADLKRGGERKGENL